jgi:hypothetical protein
MATEQEKEFSQKIRAEAKKFDKELRETALFMARSGTKLGVLLKDIRDKNLYTYLGFKELDDYRIELGVGRSTWYANLRIVDHLPKLPRKILLQLTAKNAEWLIKLPEKERYKEQWVQDALSMKEEEFGAKVIKYVNKKINGADPAGKIEQRVTVKIRCYEPVLTMWDEIRGEIARNEGLPKDDAGRAFEILLASFRTSDPAIGQMLKLGMTAMMKELKAVTKALSSDKSTDEMVEEIRAPFQMILNLVGAIGTDNPEKVKALVGKMEKAAAA